MLETLPTDLLGLFYFTTYLTLRCTTVLVLYLLGFSVVYIINRQYLSLLLPRYKMLPPLWSVTLPVIVHTFSWFLYTTLVGCFGIPDPDHISGRSLAPTFSWAVLWSVAISSIGSSSIFFCGYGVSVILENLFQTAMDKSRTTIIYDSSNSQSTIKRGFRYAVVKIELPDGASLAGCQHLTNVSPASIQSLSNDLRPGETLAVYQDGTLGTRGEDLVGIFHLLSAPISTKGPKHRDRHS
jgi:hypothetical protein